MVEVISDVFVLCPICQARLVVYWDEYYYTDDFSGEVSKDSDVAWECPNGCLFDNDQINELTEKIESQTWGNT